MSLLGYDTVGGMVSSSAGRQATNQRRHGFEYTSRCAMPSSSPPCSLHTWMDVLIFYRNRQGATTRLCGSYVIGVMNAERPVKLRRGSAWGMAGGRRTPYAAGAQCGHFCCAWLRHVCEDQYFFVLVAFLAAQRV